MCWYLLCWRHWTRSTSIRCNFSPRHIFKACVWRRKRNNLAQQSQKWIWISVSFLLMQETWNERKEGEGRCGHLWWTVAWWLIRMAKEENETLMVHTISRVSVCMCVCSFCDKSLQPCVSVCKWCNNWRFDQEHWSASVHSFCPLQLDTGRPPPAPLSFTLMTTALQISFSRSR